MSLNNRLSKIHKKLRTIEITTSQNVTITYPLASVWERILALWIDMVIMTIGALLFAGIFKLFSSDYSDIMIYLTAIPLVVLYSLLFELFNHGQSAGKMLLKIRVIRLDGDKTGFFDYLMRWVFRCLDIYFSLGSVAIISIVSSNYSQRLGDLLANTVVVSVGKTDRTSLTNLLKIGEASQKKVTYPQVTKLPESAMLVLKETLSRHTDFDNEGHEKALDLLVKKMEKELAVKAPADKHRFLNVLLHDYIVLTR
jgi:uncharacterized RDD family membrane protein YckC